MSGHLLIRRDLVRSTSESGRLEMHWSDANGAPRFDVAQRAGGGVITAYSGPSMDAAIGAFNSQVDLAWRTLWTVESPDPDGDGTIGEAEVRAALGHILKGPPASLAEELFE